MLLELLFSTYKVQELENGFDVSCASARKWRTIERIPRTMTEVALLVVCDVLYGENALQAYDFLRHDLLPTNNVCSDSLVNLVDGPVKTLFTIDGYTFELDNNRYLVQRNKTYLDSGHSSLLGAMVAFLCDRSNERGAFFLLNP